VICLAAAAGPLLGPSSPAVAAATLLQVVGHGLLCRLLLCWLVLLRREAAGIASCTGAIGTWGCLLLPLYVLNLLCSVKNHTRQDVLRITATQRRPLTTATR